MEGTSRCWQLGRADQRQRAVLWQRVEQPQLALGFSSALELLLTRAGDGASRPKRTPAVVAAEAPGRHLRDRGALIATSASLAGRYDNAVTLLDAASLPLDSRAIHTEVFEHHAVRPRMKGRSATAAGNLPIDGLRTWLGANEFVPGATIRTIKKRFRKAYTTHRLPPTHEHDIPCWSPCLAPNQFGAKHCCEHRRELDGEDLRQRPIEERILRRTARPFTGKPASSAARASCQSGSAHLIGLAACRRLYP